MTNRLITAIRIEKLFGMYTYNIPSNVTLSNSAILYGDNGVGKTTILRLAFHLLSASNKRGHRTALYEGHFHKLEVDLASGVTIAAEFEDRDGKRVLVLTIKKMDELLAVWEHYPKKNEAGRFEGVDFDKFDFITIKMIPSLHKSKMHPNVPSGDEAYLSVLEQYAPRMFMLNADRRLDSDSVPDPSDEMELRRQMQYEMPKRISDMATRSREIALSQAMNSARTWIVNNAAQALNQGSMNVHSVYVGVLNHLVSTSVKTLDDHTPSDLSILLKKLVDIETKTGQLSQYELSTALSTAEFQKALREESGNKKRLAAELLQPYIKSLEERLKALDPIYFIVDRFITMLNRFLTDKAFSFKLSKGFNIENKNGANLVPGQLSSGEQQLLLLFCYILTARDQPSVFMIDEPEISLNIKWQRQLVQSLLDLAERASIQFIFASHSLELLTQHRDRVVKMENLT